MTYEIYIDILIAINMTYGNHNTMFVSGIMGNVVSGRSLPLQINYYIPLDAEQDTTSSVQDPTSTSTGE